MNRIGSPRGDSHPLQAAQAAADSEISTQIDSIANEPAESSTAVKANSDQPYAGSQAKIAISGSQAKMAISNLINASDHIERKFSRPHLEVETSIERERVPEDERIHRGRRACSQLNETDRAGENNTSLPEPENSTGLPMPDRFAVYSNAPPPGHTAITLPPPPQELPLILDDLRNIVNSIRASSVDPKEQVQLVAELDARLAHARQLAVQPSVAWVPSINSSFPATPTETVFSPPLIGSSQFRSPVSPYRNYSMPSPDEGYFAASGPPWRFAKPEASPVFKYAGDTRQIQEFQYGIVNKRRRGKRIPVEDLKCHQCGTRQTPEWRRGPEERKILCNACGIFHNKMLRKLGKQGAFEQLKRRPFVGDPLPLLVEKLN